MRIEVALCTEAVIAGGRTPLAGTGFVAADLGTEAVLVGTEVVLALSLEGTGLVGRGLRLVHQGIVHA